MPATSESSVGGRGDRRRPVASGLVFASGAAAAAAWAPTATKALSLRHAVKLGAARLRSRCG